LNKRQKKKHNKYEDLRQKLYSSIHFMPKNWSEIRWLYRYLKTRGLIWMLPFYSEIDGQLHYFEDPNDLIKFIKESEE